MVNQDEHSNDSDGNHYDKEVTMKDKYRLGLHEEHLHYANAKSDLMIIKRIY